MNKKITYRKQNIENKESIMNKLLNKKVIISEKCFDGRSSSSYKLNKSDGTITNIYDNKFIELDNKILIAIDYIYKIQIID